jgi:peptidoglycan/LPS O-acetylase OafA/YrhL
MYAQIHPHLTDDLIAPQGLRGIASFLVILTHLARAFDYGLFFPSNHPDATPRVLQWPILRIPWQGRIGVTIFAFLTGYVCALKPLKLSRAGRTDEALSTIARSAFRRPPRLVLPATIALLISWTIAQLGGFTVANRSDCDWCRYAAPDLEDSFWKEVKRLGMNFLSTWTTGYMAYDDHQWALRPLLLGSFLVYLVLFATVYCGSRSRLVVYFALMAYYHQNGAKDTGKYFSPWIWGHFGHFLSSPPSVSKVRPLTHPHRNIPTPMHLRHAPLRSLALPLLHSLNIPPPLAPPPPHAPTGPTWPLHCLLPRRTRRVGPLVQQHAATVSLYLPAARARAETVYRVGIGYDYPVYLFESTDERCVELEVIFVVWEAEFCGLPYPRNTPSCATNVDAIRHYRTAVGGEDRGGW